MQRSNRFGWIFVVGLTGAAIAAGPIACSSGGSTPAPESQQQASTTATGTPAGPGGLDITVHEGTSMAIAVSPDKRTIAMDLQGGLWTLPASGGTAKRISDEYYDARQPAWSPDGKTIAFQSYRDGQWRIWTVAPDGSGAKAITTGAFDDREPHWSPDGRRIAFSSDRSGNIDIWILTVESGQLQQVTKNPANDFFPTWSPDGSEIAFVSNRTPEPGVYAITPEGAERLVSTTAGNVGSPSWTPGTKQVLYSVIAGGEGRLVLNGQDLVTGEDPHPFRAEWISASEFIYPADGKIKRRSIDTKTASPIEFTATLAIRPASYTRKRRDFDSTAPRRALGIMHPTLSPDGKQLAFGALGDIWIMPVGGTPARMTDDGFVDTDPAWSPDGTHIAFSSERAGGMDIWVRDLKSGADRRLTSFPDAEMAAAWSADGTRIAFISNMSFEQGTLYVVDAKGGEPKKILDRSFGPGYPSWSPDGKFIVVSALKQYSSRFREGMNYMRIVPAAGGESRLIVPVEHQPVGKRAGDGPVWSPDGKQIAYVSNGYLNVLPVGPSGDPTGPPKQITTELADSVTWAGANQLLYTATDRLKLLSTQDGTARDVPLELTWQLKNPTGRTVVHAGRLVDMKQPSARTNLDIVIEGHRIQSVEPHRDDLHTGKVIDASNLTVLPGLIEAHGHQNKEYGDLYGRIHLAYGVTTVRSPGAVLYEALEDREAIDSGKRVGPRTFSTGYLLDGARPYYPMATQAPNEAVIDMELDRAKRLDYDLLKTYVRLPDLLQKRAIDGAHKLGIALSSHEIYPAALSSVDSVEHTGATSRRGYSPKQSGLGIMYDDVIQIIAKSRMTITPTAALGGFQRQVETEPAILQDPRMQRLFPPWVLEGLQPQPGQQQGPFGGDPRARELSARRSGENLMKLLKAGARIVAGVDSPLAPYAVSLHVEIQTYVTAGFTPFQALQTATVNTAELLNLEAGTIEAGKLADLVMLEGDPLADIRNTRKVRRVIKNGEVFELDTLLKRPVEMSRR